LNGNAWQGEEGNKKLFEHVTLKEKKKDNTDYLNGKSLLKQKVEE